MLKLLPNEEAKAENTCHDLSHRHAFIANTQRTDADDEKPESKQDAEHYPASLRHC